MNTVREYVTDVPTASFNMNNIDFMFTYSDVQCMRVYLGFHTSSEVYYSSSRAEFADCRCRWSAESLRRGSEVEAEDPVGVDVGRVFSKIVSSFTDPNW